MSIYRPGPPPRLIERPRSTVERSLEREVPELRKVATRPVTVTLGRVAVEGIRDEIRADDRFIERGTGRFETGGTLVARFEPGGRNVRILVATWPGSGSRRGYERVRISRELGEEVARSYNDSRTLMCGVWHTHPEGGSWGTQPSEPDRANALEFLDYAQKDHPLLPFTVDLIVAPDSTGELWHPELTCWVTRRSNAGTPYTEPANVIGRI